MHRTQRTASAPRAERNACYSFANCTPVQALGRLLHFASLCTMKYGKYDLHKSSANLSVGTSYSWYYRKNDNPTPRKKKRLVRAASDSTLFSDYTNQISLFERGKLRDKKCKKSVSDVGKSSRVKYNPCNIKPVRMEPFTGNFFYGKTLPGYEYMQKSEEKITYLPDSDAVTASEDTTGESLTTTAPTVLDVPELVKNPLYGCRDVDLSTPEYLSGSVFSKDSQLKSSSCTELRNTMGSSKDSGDILTNILKDYKRIMKEWNHTIKDHRSSVSHCTHSSKRDSTMCRRSNTDSYVRSLHSTLSCRKPNKCLKSANNNHYSYAYASRICNEKKSNVHDKRKTQSLNRNQTFSNWTSTLQVLKKKTMFWKMNHSLTPSECKCLETIYEDYDRRLQDWCDTISHCTSLLNPVHLISVL